MGDDCWNLVGQHTSATEYTLRPFQIKTTCRDSVFLGCLENKVMLKSVGFKSLHNSDTFNLRPENITNLCQILGRFSIFLRFVRTYARELQFD